MKHTFGEIRLVSILPKMSYTDEKVITKKSNNLITVYYQNKYPNGKLKTTRFQPAVAIVPADIKIDIDTLEVFGMYYGDGQSAITSKSYQGTRFANSNPELIVKYLKFLQSLNVDKDKLKVSIRILKVQNSKPEETIVSHWCSVTKIPRHNFYSAQWEPAKYYYSKVQEFGTVSIIYSNSSFRLVFDSLAKHIQKISKKDKLAAAAFLKGLIAADGNVYFDGVHREVSIAAKEEANRWFIRTLFKKLGIMPNKDNLTKGKEATIVTGYSNMKIIEKYGLCDLHPSKRSKFENLINTYKVPNYRKGVGLSSVIDNLRKRDYTVEELSKKLDRTQNAIRRHLYFLEKSGTVRRKSKIRTAMVGRSAESWHLISSQSTDYKNL